MVKDKPSSGTVILDQNVKELFRALWVWKKKAAPLTVCLRTANSPQTRMSYAASVETSNPMSYGHVAVLHLQNWQNVTTVCTDVHVIRPGSDFRCPPCTVLVCYSYLTIWQFYTSSGMNIVFFIFTQTDWIPCKCSYFFISASLFGKLLSHVKMNLNIY